MPHIIKSVTTSWSPERAFDYMADFSHAAEWDPGVVEAVRVKDGEIGEGSTFDLTVRVAGRKMPMKYEISEFRPGRVTFTSRSPILESIDTVSVGRRGDDTEVTYDARLNFRGLLKVANPLLGLGFRGIADRAIRGLQDRLAEPV